jgi:hypothetical protein
MSVRFCYKLVEAHRPLREVIRDSVISEIGKLGHGSATHQ